MKFLSIASIVSLAVLAIAAPVVDIVERQGGTSAADAAACEQKGGTLFCCSPGITNTPGLLGVLPALFCIGVIVNLNGVCGQATTCCNQAPTAVQNQAILNILPQAAICPGVAL